MLIERTEESTMITIPVRYQACTGIVWAVSAHWEHLARYVVESMTAGIDSNNYEFVELSLEMLDWTLLAGLIATSISAAEMFPVLQGSARNMISAHMAQYDIASHMKEYALMKCGL